jgi:hypothetical protein
MKQVKHTPGPWRMIPSKSNPAFNVIGTHLGCKYKIARCPYTILTDGTPYDEKEAEANAQLIAAAPELFEALEALVEYTVYHKIPFGSGIWAKIKDAIAKATEKEAMSQ